MPEAPLTDFVVRILMTWHFFQKLYFFCDDMVFKSPVEYANLENMSILTHVFDGK